MTTDRDSDQAEAREAPGPADAVDAALDGNASTSILHGAAARGVMYAGSTGLIALAFAFVLRDTGPEMFAEFAIAIAVATIAQSIGDVAVNAVGQRLIVAAPAADRVRLQAQLVGLRFVLMPIVIGLSVAFGIAAGYDRELVESIAVIGVGTLLTVVAAAVVTPLNIELRAARASLVDFTRQLFVAIGLLAAAALSADLIGYGSVYVVAGGVAVVLAIVLVEPRWRRIALPSRSTVLLVAREASWLGLAIIVNALFLRILTVVASLETTKHEVGLFGAAARVTEVIVGLPLLMASVAYPLLSRAANDEHHDRFANATHRIVDGVQLLIGLAVVVTITAADTVMKVFASDRFADAGPVLQIQALALLFAATTQALIWSLMALRAERLLVITNLAGLAAIVGLGFALIGPYGAEGAAWAAVGGEFTLVVATLVALGVRQRSAVPPLGQTARIVLLTAACLGIGLLIPLPDALGAVVAAAAFVGGAVALRLVPDEAWAVVERFIPGRGAGSAAPPAERG